MLAGDSSAVSLVDPGKVEQDTSDAGRMLAASSRGRVQTEHLVMCSILLVNHRLASPAYHNPDPWGAGRGTPRRGGSDGEHAARSRPRTSLGDGIAKPGGPRIERAKLLRRVDWVDASVMMLTSPRERIDRTFR